jgi:hypothetical protein
MALLGQLFGGENQQNTGGGLPMKMAVLGALAYRTIKNRGSLADMLGTDGAATSQPDPGNPQTETAGEPSGLTGMLSGGLGGLTGCCLRYQATTRGPRSVTVCSI